jgi:poly-gamma-glutamate synthesis protein (capsule biosynthesis protein)
MPTKNKNKKKLPIIAAILFIAFASIIAWYFFFRSDTTNSTQNSNQQVADANQNASNVELYPNRIRLIASGDVVGHDSVNANAKQSDGSYNYYPFMENMAPIFKTADIDFCNQVTPAGGVEFGVKGYPKFNAPTELVRDLGKVGSNAVNMASNHSFDVSQDAINANVDAWGQVPNMLAYAGQNRSVEERDSVEYFTVKGVKFAFLAYTTYINANAPAQNNYGATQYSRSLASTQIAEAKQNGADVILVSIRWGTEYSNAINAQQNTEAQYLADQGVSLVLGHGPHVLQPVKELTGTSGNKTYVWYSLGNFLNTQLEAEALFNGFAVIDYDKNTKQITNVAYLPIYMHYEWSAADAASEKLLARKNLKLYLLENTTQEMIDSQQLKTTVDDQKLRITDVLNTYTEIPIINKATYDK